MGSKIPKQIKKEVLRKWLGATFRDKIATELNISQGAVTNIINEIRKDDLEFDLLREVALKIKNQGEDIISFAPLIRVREVLREKGFLTDPETHDHMQDRLEAVIVAFEMFCFKRNLSVEDLIGHVTNIYDAAEILGVPLDKFPEYIADLKNTIDVLVKETGQLETKKQIMLEDCATTAETLLEYNANKPLVVKIQKLKRELADAKQALKSEKSLNKIGEELEWSVYEDPGTWDLKYLRKLVMHVYQFPRKYREIIREIIREYNISHINKG